MKSTNDNKNTLNFACIGAAKCATTWLYNCLSEHPEIRLPNLKEMEFFTEIKPFYNKERRLNSNMGLNWYWEQFPPLRNEKTTGEVSVNYIFDPSVAKKIHNLNSDMKIIACIRNPIERTYSHYQHAKANLSLKHGKTIKPLREVINNEVEFIEYSNYYKHLKIYYKIFPRENILVLLMDDLKKDPSVFLKTIFNFLEVDPNFRPKNTNLKVNQTANKSSFVYKLIYKVNKKTINSPLRKNFVTFLNKTGLRKSLINLINKSKTLRRKHYKKISRRDYTNLYNIYNPQIKNLEILLKRDLSDWYN